MRNKNLYIIIGIFYAMLIFNNYALAESFQWETRIVSPDYAVGSPALALYKKQLYTFGGNVFQGPGYYDDQYTDQIAIYDIDSDSWQKAGNLPYGRRAAFGSHLTIIGNICYLTPAIGPTQNNGWGTHGSLIEYALSSHTCAETADFVGYGNIWTCGIASTSVNELYAFGGWTGSGVNKIFKYDSTVSQMEPLTDEYVTAGQPASVCTDRYGDIVLFGVEPRPLRRVQIFDPSSESIVYSGDIIPEEMERSYISWTSSWGDTFLANTKNLKIHQFDIDSKTFISKGISLPTPIKGTLQSTYVYDKNTDKLYLWENQWDGTSYHAVIWIGTFSTKDIIVKADGSGDYLTIQSAIDAAENGDVIILESGIYTGTGNRDLNFKGKAITIQSTDPNDSEIVANTVIDCQASYDDQHRGFIFQNGEDANSILTGITIKNGYQQEGGGILCDQSSSPTITKCRIIQNSTVRPGEGGGGICCLNNSSPRIIQCYISNNYSQTTGGGIKCEDYCTPLIEDCRIENNESSWDGGGICCDNYCSAEIINCAFAYNITGSNGGGIYCEDQSNLSIKNSFLLGNRTIWDEELGGGSAISSEYSDVTIVNCTIAQNIANVNGTIDCFGRDDYGPANMRIINTIVWDNNPGGGYDITIGEGDYPQDNSTMKISYSDIHGGQANCITDEYTQLLWGPGNIDADPLFSVTAGDYHLQSTAGRWEPDSGTWINDTQTSPCIDAGNPGCESTQEPAPRGSRINMGAHGGTAQASKSPDQWRNIADLTNDWKVNGDDLSVFVDYWLDSGTCMPSDFNRDKIVTLEDFGIFASNFGWDSSISQHIFHVHIENIWDYQYPDNSEDTIYEFHVEIITDQAVDFIEFLTPAGNLFDIPKESFTHTSTPQGDIYTSREYEDDPEMSGFAWDYSGEFSVPEAFEDYGNGEYIITVYYMDGTQDRTSVWFGMPGTTEPIPQPTQQPVITSFTQGETLVSPITIEWQSCTEPEVNFIFIELENSYDLEFLLPADSTRIDEPVDLEAGVWEIGLEFVSLFAGENRDGIPIELGKVSEVDYEILLEEVNTIEDVYEISIETGIDYGNPDLTDDTQYEFNVEIKTETTVQAIQFVSPAGGIYELTETSPGEWEYEANFSSIMGLDNLGDGKYVFTVTFDNDYAAQTSAWFTVPGSTDPIPQPTQIPTYTSFSNGDVLSSPITLSWQSCNDPTLYTINVSITDTSTWEDVLDEELPGSATELGETVALEAGEYENDLSFDIDYTTTNEDGISLGLSKWCESDYQITVESLTVPLF